MHVLKRRPSVNVNSDCHVGCAFTSTDSQTSILTFVFSLSSQGLFWFFVELFFVSTSKFLFIVYEVTQTEIID